MPSPEIRLSYYGTYPFDTEQVDENGRFSQTSNCHLHNSTLSVSALYFKWQKSTRAALRKWKFCRKTWISLERSSWVPRLCREHHSHIPSYRVWEDGKAATDRSETPRLTQGQGCRSWHPRRGKTSKNTRGARQFEWRLKLLVQFWEYKEIQCCKKQKQEINKWYSS